MNTKNNNHTLFSHLRQPLSWTYAFTTSSIAYSSVVMTPIWRGVKRLSSRKFQMFLSIMHINNILKKGK